MSQPPLEGDSSSATIAGVKGTNAAGGNGIFGDSSQSDAVVGFAHAQGKAGVLGLAPSGNAVAGISDNATGVYGQGGAFGGFFAAAGTAVGVQANSASGNAVHGDSSQGDALVGFAHAQGKAGVLGLSPIGNAVAGLSDSGTGVFGTGGAFGGFFAASGTAVGVQANSASGNAVHGDSSQGDALVGFAHAQGKAGVLGLSPIGNALAGISDNGTGVYAQGGNFAAWFAGKVHVQGDVEVTGDVSLLGQDCAEDFDVAEARTIEPGSVVVIGEDGALRESSEAYDKRVAGVVSGAGDFRPAICLGRVIPGEGRAAIALVGKVFCAADAQYAPIEVGDLLTTSGTPGHAMKAVAQDKSFGAVIGKALRPLPDGRGLIPILIALQ